jgi:hypothetical protein
MTDPVTDQPPGNGSTVPVLVPEGKTASDLTMRELDIVSRKIEADALVVISARGAGHPARYRALALVGWLWAKRTDPAATYDTFFDYEVDDLFHALRMDVPKTTQEPEDPTSPVDERSDSA